MWVGETGWPTDEHPLATLTNAFYYTQNVVKRQQGLSLWNDTLDTPRFKGLRYSTFYFQAFDELKKFEIEHGNRFENNFGMFFEDGTPKWKDSNGMIDLPIEGKLDHNNDPPVLPEFYYS